jgi:hypothetical protein
MAALGTCDSELLVREAGTHRRLYRRLWSPHLGRHQVLGLAGQGLHIQQPADDVGLLIAAPHHQQHLCHRDKEVNYMWINLLMDDYDNKPT